MEVETQGHGTRFLLSTACFVIIVAGMKAAATLLVPFMMALFLSILSAPLLSWLRARRIPNWLAVPLTIAVILFTIFAIGTLIGGSLNQFSAKIPTYQERLDQIAGSARDQIDVWGKRWDIDTAEWMKEVRFSPGLLMGYIGTALSSATVLLSNLTLVLLTVVFVLLEASGFPDKLRQAFNHDLEGVQRIAAITHEVQTYFGLKTIISLATGLVAGTFLATLGIDFFLLWGFLTFLLNYIPNIGSIMAAIPPVLLAMVQFGFGTAAIVVVGYLAINLILGNLIEPRLMGRRLGLSTLVVFLSLCFWGWVWGPVGMFLSVPLTMFAKILLENSGDLKWLAVMLSGDTDT